MVCDEHVGPSFFDRPICRRRGFRRNYEFNRRRCCLDVLCLIPYLESRNRKVVQRFLRTGTWILSRYRGKHWTDDDTSGAGGVRCFAFEPEPANFLNLKRNIATNCPADSVKLFQLALADTSGDLEFEVSPRLGDQRVRAAHSAPIEPDVRVIKVGVARLDEVLPDLEGRIAAKIDTQGAEPLVFAGGSNVLSRASLIVAEFWPWGMERLGREPSEMLAFLRHNFAEMSVKHYKSAEYGAWRPSNQVCEELRELHVKLKGNKHDHYDVAARR